MCGFVRIGPVIAVGHSQGIQTHDLTAITNDVDTIALNRRRRRNAALWPIEVRVFLALRDDELPKKSAGFFFKTHQHTTVALMPGIAGHAIIGSDVNAAVGDYWRGMRLSAELRGPFDVVPGPDVEGLGKVSFIRNHVASPRVAPLRLVQAIDIAHRQGKEERERRNPVIEHDAS
jgi:hypothetical protein